MKDFVKKLRRYIKYLYNPEPGNTTLLGEITKGGTSTITIIVALFLYGIGGILAIKVGGSFGVVGAMVAAIKVFATLISLLYVLTVDRTLIKFKDI